MTGPVSEVPDLCCRKFPSAQATEDPRHSGVLIRAPIHAMNERSSMLHRQISLMHHYVAIAVLVVSSRAVVLFASY